MARKTRPSRNRATTAVALLQSGHVISSSWLIRKDGLVLAVARTRLEFGLLFAVSWLLAAVSLSIVWTGPLYPRFLTNDDDPLAWLIIVWWPLIPWILCLAVAVLRHGKRSIWLLASAPFALFFPLLTLVFSDGGFFVESSPGNSVLSAKDLESCEILARLEFEPHSAETDSAFNNALVRGTILHLANGTNVKQGAALNFTDHHLVPYVPTGPITVGEEVRRHIGVYMWMLLKDGPYRGKQVCISRETLRGKYPPL